MLTQTGLGGAATPLAAQTWAVDQKNIGESVLAPRRMQMAGHPCMLTCDEEAAAVDPLIGPLDTGTGLEGNAGFPEPAAGPITLASTVKGRCVETARGVAQGRRARSCDTCCCSEVCRAATRAASRVPPSASLTCPAAALACRSRVDCVCQQQAHLACSSGKAA